MAQTLSKFIFKRSSVASAEPDPSYLDPGEVALNYTDGKLFYKDNLGVVQELTSTPAAASESTLSVPPEMIRLTTIKSSVTFVLYASSTSGFYATMFWDGTITITPNGNPANLAIPASPNPWSESAPKEVYVWSCVSGTNAIQSGTLTYFESTFMDITSFETEVLSSMTSINLDSNRLTKFSSAEYPLLDTINLSSNQIRSISGYYPSLLYLYFDGNLLTSFNDGGNLPLLSQLYLNGNANLVEFTFNSHPYLATLDLTGTAVESLSLVGLTGLLYLDASFCPLTSFNISGCSALNFIYATDNLDLTSANVSSSGDELNINFSGCSTLELVTGLDTSDWIVLEFGECDIDLATTFPNSSYISSAVPLAALSSASITLTNNNLLTAELETFYGILPIVTNSPYLYVDLNAVGTNIGLIPTDWIVVD
jgi:hypothetical protein